MDCFIHQTYGRMRVRIASLKGNLPFCRILMQDLSSLSGVRRVVVNDLTGSIVIHYDPVYVPPASLLRVFQRRKLLHNVIGFPNSPLNPMQLARAQGLPMEDWVSETVGYASRALFKTLIEAALQKTGHMILKKILP